MQVSEEKGSSTIIGKCPVLKVGVGNMTVQAILDTGSQVTTLEQAFFENHFQDKEILKESYYKLKAANGIEIPYIGYFHTDLKIGEEVVKDAGVFVTETTKNSPNPILLGMNVLNKCKHLGSLLDNAALVNAIQAEGKSRGTAKFAKTAEDMTFLPANNISTILVSAGVRDSETPIMIQHLASQCHLPRGIVVVDTVATKMNGLYPLHVANMGQKDVWLKKGVRVGHIQEADIVFDSDCETHIEVKVNEIVVSRQEVEIDQSGQDENIKLPEVDFSQFNPEQACRIRQFLKNHASCFPRGEIGFSDTVQQT